MGEENKHTHDRLQFYILTLSLLGREEGGRTGLLELPVQCVPAQKTEREL